MIGITPTNSYADVIPVVNPKVSQREISLSEAIQIYTGKVLYWPDGQSVIVVVLPREHMVSRQFIFDKLAMSPFQFYESLDISINIRKNNSVIRVNTENEVIRVIKNNPGSIGYASDHIYFNYKDEVKKLRIR